MIFLRISCNACYRQVLAQHSTGTTTFGMDAAHVILLKICGQKQGEPGKLSPTVGRQTAEIR